MHTQRFGRRLKLASTVAIKHQIRKLILEDSVKTAEPGARTEAHRGNCAKRRDLSKPITR